MTSLREPRPHILWVGAFPPEGSTIVGGFVTSCRVLRASSFGDRVELTLIDSTQPNNPAPSRAKRAWMAATRLARYVVSFERTRPDAVLLFASSTQASVAEKGLMAWYARLRGSATLLFPRGGAVLDAGRASPRIARWLRAVFRSAHVVLCQGPAWQRFAIDTLGIAPADAILVPNWTATPQHLALGAARHTDRRQQRGRPVRLVFVGWVNREKGTLELVEACHRLRDRHQFELVLVGDGVAADEVRARIARHGLTDRVRITGWLAGDDLLRAYAEADVFVLPSWAEGLPNAMIEAMASGLAVVVSAVGTIPGLVTDGREALLVPPRDVDALVEALERLLADGPLRERLGRTAAEWAAEQFGVEAAADRLVDATRHAIARAHGRHRPARADRATGHPTAGGNQA